MACLVPLPSSCANILPMIESEAEIYNLMHLLLTGGDNIEGCCSGVFVAI